VSWDLVGGNPAPGSPQSVAAAAAVLEQVADLAAEARQTLIRSTGQLGAGDWKGTAADAFRRSVTELPQRLGEVEQSYAEASGALQSFRDALEHAQYEAQAALRMAEQAAADRDAAHRKRDSARGDVTSLRASRLSAAARLTVLLAQRTTTIDPTQRAALDAPIAAARTRVNRLQADEDAAERTEDHHAAAGDEAEDRLRRAKERAEAIKRDLRSRADAAIRALAAAERDAHLPNFLERAGSDAKHLLVTYGPKVAGIFQIAQTVFSIAAMVFPPGAVVFGAAALICGGTALIFTTSAQALSPEGMTGAAWAELGLGALGLVAGGFALGGAVKAAQAAKTGIDLTTKGALLARSAQLSKVSGVIDKTVEYGGLAKEGIENYQKEGWAGVAKAGGSFVIGKVGEAGIAKLVQPGLRAANKVPAVSDKLTSMTRSVGRRTTQLGFDIPVDTDATRTVQSLLGHLPPGAAVDPDAVSELAEGIVGETVGVTDDVLELFDHDGLSEMAYDAVADKVTSVASHVDGVVLVNSGLDALNSGVDAVNSGLEAVNSGVDTVASGLDDAASRVADAASGLADAASGLADAASSIDLDVNIDIDVDLDVDLSWGSGR
jgi:uncharacterized protein YukE